MGFRATIEAPFGAFLLECSDEGLVAAGTRLARTRSDASGAPARRHLDVACHAFREYLAGTRTTFDDVVLAPGGTRFQARVWTELRRLAFGATTTYRDLARQIGRPTAARAVGRANGQNPIAVFIPCHRVVGADGGLTGYAGGLAMKAWLLRHEGAAPGRDVVAGVTSPQCAVARRDCDAPREGCWRSDERGEQ